MVEFSADKDADWLPVMTSYDYDAPLREEGDTTLKFFAVRDLLSSGDRPVPSNTTKFSVGILPVKYVGSVFDAAVRGALNDDAWLRSSPSAPLTFEDAWLDYGFMLYEHAVERDVQHFVLDLGVVRDRAYVFLAGRLHAILNRWVQKPVPFAELVGAIGQGMANDTSYTFPDGKRVLDFTSYFCLNNRKKIRQC